MDLSSKYRFPCHVVATDLQPDIIIWDDTTIGGLFGKALCVFGSLFQGAARKEECQYCKVQASFAHNGYRANLTLENWLMWTIKHHWLPQAEKQVYFVKM